MGLYARIRQIDTKQAFKELLERECYSLDKSHIEISPINLIADIKVRDQVYREFLSMLKLEPQHKRYLKGLGLLDTSIENGLYRTVPNKYIKRRLVCSNLARRYNLARNTWFFSRRRF